MEIRIDEIAELKIKNKLNNLIRRITMRLLVSKMNANKKQVTYYINLVPDNEFYSQEAHLKIEKKILELSKKHKRVPIVYDRRDNPYHKIAII
ncbi:MAG: hypothetical protein LC124_07280 [Ignavibacteriales bacterium]|nr:hypothetical protein [Ignavibacteriales bacterium]MDX9712492.1 hypothetical protein [Ignavibacteriaceae bacterium]